MEMNGMVVGVDGSAASVAALRWAIAQARAHGCPITAVEVRAPAHPLPGASYAVQPYGSAPPVERTRTRLHDTVTAAVATVADAPEIVEMRLEGDPGAELVRAAHDTGSTLVLGYTPHTRLTEFLFGRVTGECLRLSRQPVVLVPDSGRR
ncbi:universal stress protein [Actinophytocola oryzae]|nr:universal stress protein [Actinophytocola oryzae]